MNDEIDAGLLAELEACGWPCYRLGRPEGRVHPRYFAQIASIVRRHAVAVVHAHNEGSRKWAMLLRFWRPGLRVVYTLHCQGLADGYGPLARWLYRLGVDATVSISDATTQEGRMLRPRRLVQIANGVDLERFRAARRDQGSRRPFRILQIGRFHPEKGHDLLLRALAEIRAAGVEAVATLAGVTVGATDPWVANLRRLAQSLGLEDVVSFVFGRTDVENLLAEADVCALPSRAEGFGLALVEAMAAGVPVVAARAGGPAQIVQDGVNGLLFPAEDHRALAAALRRLESDPNLRRRLSAEGSAAAEGYGIDATLRDHARVYAELAA